MVAEERIRGAVKSIKTTAGREVEIELKLNPFGEVASSTLVRSSGSTRRDQEAQRAFAVVIGQRPSVAGLRCSSCPWYVRVIVPNQESRK